MPKIRTIKPDYWTDGVMVKLPPLARLLFIGTWNFACDHGHLPDDSLKMKLQILPFENCDIDALLMQLVDAGRIERIDVDGRPWLLIPRFKDHQRIETRWQSRCPACAHFGFDTSPDLTEPRASSRGLAETRANSRKEGKGREGKGSDAPADADDGFAAFWDLYPRKISKGAAATAYKKAVKKTSADNLTASLRKQLPWFASQLKADGDFRPHASSWLNQERWGDEPVAPAAGRRAQANPALGDWR